MRTASDALSVTQLNEYIKTLMDRDDILGQVAVRGELSNYKVYPSGHHYFSLKDAQGSLRCVMFRRETVGLRFRPENGMKVVAYGRVTVFPRDGQYQLYCSVLTTDGMGDLHVAFEQLKAKLYTEGLFDTAHKKTLPRLPRRIALITSPAGAVVRDMLRVLEARWPMAEVAVVSVRVQGTEAPEELSAALDWVNAHHSADLIIIGRGGGSMEDLWAFNEETVARAIYRSGIPVVSAVGHEPDVTISDFVADLRAATPSNAAELVVPDQNDVYERLYQLTERAARAMSRQTERQRSRLDYLKRNRALQSPINYIEDRRVLLDYQRTRLVQGLTAALNGERQHFARLAASLDALSPLKVLGRGYAIAQKESGGVVRSVRDVDTGERLSLRVSDGTVDVQTL